MINENALVAYKNRPAVVRETAGDKIHIELAGGEKLKVREKDFEAIHAGPVKDIGGIEKQALELCGTGGARSETFVREAWELLRGEGSAVSLSELADLVFGDSGTAAAWAAFRLLVDGLYFAGTPESIVPRKSEDVEAEEKKRYAKQRESGEREQFLQRMRRRMKASPCKNASEELPDANDMDGSELSSDARFIQDVEALAFGKSEKSRTMKELGLEESPGEAHALLLKTGFWTSSTNPHPARFGLSTVSAKTVPAPPPDEERRDLCRLAAFAIDSPWSCDPDDAISFEEAGGARILYVHIADPASSIAADSLCEREARDRGATLYLPEGSARMISSEALPLFALGLAEKSPALTFKITLERNGGFDEIADIEIFPSTVKARRLTYEAADQLLDEVSGNGASPLRGLYELAQGNMRRRAAAGAVNIELPEVHISVVDDRVTIEPVVSYRSGDLVRECMLLAGEAAALWALGRRGRTSESQPAFPFVSQEAGDIPGEILDGLAGSYQLRRCMRPRTLSPRPAPHWGLGLDVYTQVTSPLRRYTDLLAHLQIRALLRGGQPLPPEELASRLAAGEAAAQAVAQAERASRLHWTLAYLSDKKDSIWDAAALEKKGNRWVMLIPALALETQVPLRKDVAPNDAVKLALKKVDIPRGEAVFALDE
jgi:exoribonuclease-2